MDKKELERELKLLARQLVWIKDELEKVTLRDWEELELRMDYTETLKKLYAYGYTEEMVLEYMEQYRELELGAMQKWLNGEL